MLGCWVYTVGSIMSPGKFLPMRIKLNPSNEILITYIRTMSTVRGSSFVIFERSSDLNILFLTKNPMFKSKVGKHNTQEKKKRNLVAKGGCQRMRTPSL